MGSERTKMNVSVRNHMLKDFLKNPVVYIHTCAGPGVQSLVRKLGIPICCNWEKKKERKRKDPMVQTKT